MNRRRFLIALAVLVPLALFGFARSAASWRPVKLASFPQQRGDQPFDGVRASARYVVLENVYAQSDVMAVKRTLFDLETGQARELGQNEGIADEGAWRWELQTGDDNPQLLLRQGDAAPVSYALQPDDGRQMIHLYPSVRFLRVRPALNRVELLLGERLYRWNKTTGQRQRSAKLAYNRGYPLAISRDGETLFGADSGGVALGEARTGYYSRTVPVAGVERGNDWLMTDYGGFALVNINEKWPPRLWQVAQVANGRVLWSLEHDSYREPIFSSDEKELAFFVSDRKIWEVRDLNTGAVLRTLPLVPGTFTGAFSPDGATLYSVAGGVLYRQRAR